MIPDKHIWILYAAVGALMVFTLIEGVVGRWSLQLFF